MDAWFNATISLSSSSDRAAFSINSQAWLKHCGEKYLCAAAGSRSGGLDMFIPRKGRRLVTGIITNVGRKSKTQLRLATYLEAKTRQFLFGLFSGSARVDGEHRIVARPELVQRSDKALCLIEVLQGRDRYTFSVFHDAHDFVAPDFVPWIDIGCHDQSLPPRKQRAVMRVTGQYDREYLRPSFVWRECQGNPIDS